MGMLRGARTQFQERNLVTLYWALAEPDTTNRSLFDLACQASISHGEIV